MTPPREYPEPEAWRRIAARLEHRGTVWGLCYEVAEMRRAARSDYGGITFETCMAMRRRIKQHLAAMPRTDLDYYDQPAPPEWGWPCGDAAPRILACEFLALEAESEAA